MQRNVPSQNIKCKMIEGCVKVHLNSFQLHTFLIYSGIKVGQLLLEDNRKVKYY